MEQKDFPLHSLNEPVVNKINSILEMTSKAVMIELEDILNKIQKVAQLQQITSGEDMNEIIKKVENVKRNMASTDKS
jgi:hypothetical protein